MISDQDMVEAQQLVNEITDNIASLSPERQIEISCYAKAFKGILLKGGMNAYTAFMLLGAQMAAEPAPVPESTPAKSVPT